MPHVAPWLAVAVLGAAPAALAGTPPPIQGDWDGGLTVPAGMTVPLTLHLNAAGSSLDSPDQHAAGVPANLSRDGNKWVIEVPSSHARLTADLSADGQTLSGVFAQGGMSMPAHFSRRAPGAAAPALDRPQTPKPPFPYVNQDVTFAGGGGVTLAGTFSHPPGDGPFPAVVMLAGSGPQNRDETVEGHKIFLVIADRLTRAGVAVLRYDKRGVEASKGSYADATAADFTADAEGAVRWLQARSDVAPGKIGLIGHSEGAEVAPVVADADPHVAFVVLLSTPAIPGVETIVSQQRAILLASGAPEAQVDVKSAIEQRLLDEVRRAPDQASAQAAALKVLTEAGAPPDRAAVQAREVASPWYREFLNDDPAPALRKLRQPVLVVAGSKDLQVLPDLNLPVIRAALAANENAKIVELDGLNHMLQPATTGAPSEYGAIPITVAPAALDLITDWVTARTR